jgi:hypothetical protein
MLPPPWPAARCRRERPDISDRKRKELLCWSNDHFEKTKKEEERQERRVNSEDTIESIS